MFFELTIGIILRGFIYSCDLIKRPELNSISNSFEKLTENRYSQNQSILAKSLLALCDFNHVNWFILLCVFDILSARLIGSLGKLKFNVYTNKYMLWAWLNPIAIITTGGLSQGVISNTVILACWYSALKEQYGLSSLFLVLAMFDRYYPFQLIIPIMLLTKHKIKFISFFTFWIAVCCYLQHLTGSSILELFENWEVILNLTEYEPGLNYSWYMLIELFDHFRHFFVMIIQVQMFCYVIPLCMRFPADIALMYLIPIIYVFAPYSTISDVALLLSITPLYNYGKRQFFSLLVIGTSIALCPIMWYLWADSMAGNANFYFATSLAVTTGSILLITDSIFAELTKTEGCGLSVRLERPNNRENSNLKHSKVIQ